MEKLLDILDNPKGKLIAVDLDGTLCEGEFRGEGEPKPINKMINYINELYFSGGHIIIYTARSPDFFRVTFSWLIKFGVCFHGIAMQMKPGADVYIDDKSLHITNIKC